MAVFNANLSDETAADMALAKQVAEKLERDHPTAEGRGGMGHGWAVMASHGQGVVEIRNLRLEGMFPMPMHLAYVIKLGDLDPTMREVTRAAGGLLEAYNVPRAPYSRDLYEDATPAAGADQFDVRKQWAGQG